MNLTDNDLQFEVLVEGKVISTHGSHVLAEVCIDKMDESTKKRATIVPVTKSGKQFLLG
jgi:hypothetical protein